MKPRRVIGIVRSIRDRGPTSTPRPQVYSPIESPRSLMFVVRVDGSAKEHMATIRDITATVDPRVPVYDAKTMDERLTGIMATPRLYTTAVAFFGLLAPLLSILGVYGAVASACNQRSRELGIRMALGTTPTHLRARLLLRALSTVTIGGVLGLLLVSVVGKYLATLLRGADAAVLNASVASFVGTLVVAGSATWMATRRIGRIDINDVVRPSDHS
jgi:putative ABC transport system permease protein